MGIVLMSLPSTLEFKAVHFRGGGPVGVVGVSFAAWEGGRLMGCHIGSCRCNNEEYGGQEGDVV
jgi:hypothetical protein